MRKPNNRARAIRNVVILVLLLVWIAALLLPRY